MVYFNWRELPLTHRLRALAILTVLLLAPSALFAIDFVWTGLGADDNWSTALNWDQGLSYPGEVGGRFDTATIAVAPRLPTLDVALAEWLTLLDITGNTLTLTTAMGVDSLTMSGGTIDGPALTDITVRDDVSITAGTLNPNLTLNLTGAVGLRTPSRSTSPFRISRSPRRARPSRVQRAAFPGP